MDFDRLRELVCGSQSSHSTKILFLDYLEVGPEFCDATLETIGRSSCGDLQDEPHALHFLNSLNSKTSEKVSSIVIYGRQIGTGTRKERKIVQENRQSIRFRLEHCCG